MGTSETVEAAAGSTVDYSAFKPFTINKPCAKFTAEMVIQNEEFIIEESLVAAADNFGQVVVIDHGSTDRTPDIIHRVSKHFPNVYSARVSPWHYSYNMARNLALTISTTDWQLKWDADFLPFNRSVTAALCTFILNAETAGKSDDSYMINIPRLDGDKDHARASNPVHLEQYVFRKTMYHYITEKNMPDVLAPRPGMNPKIGYDLLKDLPGSVGGVYMVSLATLKPIQKLYQRPMQSPYLLYQKACSQNSSLPMLTFDEWMFMRVNKRMPLSEELPGYHKHLLHWFCTYPYELIPYNSTKWPLSHFMLWIAKSKFELFKSIPIPPDDLPFVFKSHSLPVQQPSSPNGSFYYLNPHGCSSLN